MGNSLYSARHHQPEEIPNRIVDPQQAIAVQNPAFAETEKEEGTRTNRKRKRKKKKSDDQSDESDEESDDGISQLMRTPKKIKLRTTSRYIYDTLFLQSQDYDVTLEALDEEWKLHKLYLCQSKYFSCMFSGNWKESSAKHIRINIADPRITSSALQTAFGSLYQDEITVEPSKVIPILATATLFQLEGLIQQCSQTMQDTINIHTVVDYYEAAKSYGSMATEEKCLEWLHVNLLSFLPEQPSKLRKIPLDLMLMMIESEKLFVMQTEFSAYVLLRLWVFLQFHPEWEGNPQDAVLTSHKHFQEKAKSDKTYFLETTDGRQFVELFKKLRLNHLINHHMDMEMLLTDRIIPRNWMFQIYETQWRTLLKVDQGIDRGPSSLTDEQFNKFCLRCGRTLNQGGQQHMWRWTGFNMGLDLIITYDNFSLSIKRNQNSSIANEHEGLLSTHKKRNVWYRVKAATLNEQKQVTYLESTGIQSVCLAKNGNQLLMRLDKEKVKFPLFLSFNFVTSSPRDDDNSDTRDEENQADLLPIVDVP